MSDCRRRRFSTIFTGLYGFLFALLLVLLGFFLLARPARLGGLHNMSLPMDAQIEASVLALPKQPDEIRLVFLSNCFFHGAVRNGARVTVLPDSLTIVRRIERWLIRQPELTGKTVRVFNASVDGTSILDHLALTAKLGDYQIDALVIAMAYTEFRQLPLHPLLGNLKGYLKDIGIELSEVENLSKSRGRLVSVDFQRWLTARKYDLWKELPPVTRLLLWNRELRKRLQPIHEDAYYRQWYGGKAIPLQHIGLGARVEQNYRGYLEPFLAFTAERGIGVVLVNQPIRFKQVIEKANPGLFSEHREFLRAAARDHHRCGFIDLDGEIPVEVYLSDYIHLTYDGVETLSALLAPRILEVLVDLGRVGKSSGKAGTVL